MVRDEGLQAARSAEKDIMSGEYRGHLHGIPVGVKDTHYTKGFRTKAGTPLLADLIPTFDATVVTRLKNAGAVLVGKTNPSVLFNLTGFPALALPAGFSLSPPGMPLGLQVSAKPF